MPIHPLAGRPAPADILIEPEQLEHDYYSRKPDPENPLQQVSFGTSGHRGTPGEGTFNEDHILAITQAICEFRKVHWIDGPLFLGKDTHAVSEAAHRTTLEVLAANGVATIIQEKGGFTPTPVISRAILVHNYGGAGSKADGVVITPSHNPPSDGGFKYNPPNGGPADTDVTGWIQDRANDLLQDSNVHVRRIPYERAVASSTVHAQDLILPYVKDLGAVVDLESVRSAGVRIGIDPLGGASAGYWEPVRDIYRVDLTVVHAAVDPTFRFMPVDHDGKIRMDCSSQYAMAELVRLKDRFDVAFGNDPDADRHGIVTPSSGLLNPNHYLAAAIDYLLGERGDWPAVSRVGKTMVSSSMIDRVVESHGRGLYEVPVGFKWFTPELCDGSICFGGEESAGASFLRRNGHVWATDKDGMILGLLAAEITARTGKDPGQLYGALAERFGAVAYTRIDAAAAPELKNRLKHLRPADVTARELAGEPILDKLTVAPGNGAQLGGLKVIARSGWFAARPSGTEDVYKLYAESWLGPAHLEQILEEARRIIGRCLPV